LDQGSNPCVSTKQKTMKIIIILTILGAIIGGIVKTTIPFILFGALIGFILGLIFNSAEIDIDDIDDFD